MKHGEEYTLHSHSIHDIRSTVPKRRRAIKLFFSLLFFRVQYSHSYTNIYYPSCSESSAELSEWDKHTYAVHGRRRRVRKENWWIIFFHHCRCSCAASNKGILYIWNILKLFWSSVDYWFKRQKFLLRRLVSSFKEVS